MLLNCGVGEDSWESFGLQRVKPVHPKGSQSWIFIGRTDAETETPILWPPDAKITHWKRPWCWERLRAGGEGDIRGWDGWMASPTQWTWVWASSRRWWWTRKLGMLQSIGSQRVRHNWTRKRLNWIHYTLVCMLSPFSHVWLFVSLGTVTCQAPLSMGILQARILEWVAMPSSRGSFWLRDRTQVSCIAGRIFYHPGHQVRPIIFTRSLKLGKNCIGHVHSFATFNYLTSVCEIYQC